MIKSIKATDYRNEPYIFPPKAFIDDKTLNIEYIVDSFRDRKFNDMYTREYIRFKVTKNSMEVYYGNVNNELLWERYDIISTKSIDFGSTFVKNQIKDWFKEKIQEEEEL